MSYFTKSIQVVLVFDNALAFDGHFADLSSIEGGLLHALQDFGQWHSLKGYNTPNHLGLASDTRHMTLQRFDAPMAMNGFADVLANPLVQNAKPKQVQAIMEHQRAILVEVCAGNVPGFANALSQTGLGDILGGADALAMGLTDDQAGLETRLLIAQVLTLALIKKMAPSAVHWVQSQQVFDAQSFSSLAANGFSLPLYCGPFIYGGKQLADGSVEAGVRALGSQDMLGKMVIFAPDVQDWADSHTSILAFIAYCRSIGRILEDGETFSADEPNATKTRVAHMTDIPQLPDGYIQLSVDTGTRDRNARTKIVRANPTHIDAARRGARNKLSGRPAPARTGLLGKIFGRKRA